MKSGVRKLALLAVLLAAFGARDGVAMPAPTTSPLDVLATFGSARLTRGDLEAMFAQSPAGMKQKGRRSYLEELVRFRTLLETARKKGLDKSPAVLARLTPRLHESLAKLVFQEAVAKRPPIAESLLRQTYEARKALLREPESLEARELHASSAEDAKGFKFVVEHAGGIDGLGAPLRARVSDLGRVYPGTIPAEQWAFLKKQKPGVVSEPFQTKSGWSAFLVQAVHPERERAFAEVEPALRQELTAQRDEAILKELLTECSKRTEIRLHADRMNETDSRAILAEVGDWKVRRQDLLAEVQKAEGVMREYFTQEAGRRLLLDRLVQRECMARMALDSATIQAAHGRQIAYAADKEVVETLLAEECYRHVRIDEAELRRYYRENLRKFGREQVDSSHILFARKTKDRKERAGKALERLRAGEPFAALATELSEDPGTKPKGGSLGWFSRGFLVNEYEKAVFSMQEGQITSRPVESLYGLHIIQLAGLRKAVPFEQVRDAVEKELAQKLRDEAYEKFVARCRAELAVRVMPESLPPDPPPPPDPSVRSMMKITVTSDGSVQVAPPDK